MSTIKHLIEKYYDQFFEDKFKGRDDLKSFFKQHANRPVVLESMLKGLSDPKAQKYLHTSQKLKSIVYDVLTGHCQTAINLKEREIKRQQNKLFDEFGVEKPRDLGEDPGLPDGVEVGIRE